MTAAIVSIGSVVLGEIAFDPGIHQQWRASLQQDVTGWTWLYVNASAWAPWARAFRPSPSFAHVLEPTLAVLPALVSRSRRLPGCYLGDDRVLARCASRREPPQQQTCHPTDTSGGVACISVQRRRAGLDLHFPDLHTASLGHAYCPVVLCAPLAHGTVVSAAGHRIGRDVISPECSSNRGTATPVEACT